jgi:SAM-dependent methyltransferase
MHQGTEETRVSAEMTRGLCELSIRHPPGTFALTPASLISLQAIGQHQELLEGHGLDWGSGSGCLAIAAAKIPAVQSVTGLEIAEANVLVARDNAIRNSVGDKVAFLVSDSYSPIWRPSEPASDSALPANTCGFTGSPKEERVILDRLAGKVGFILANPPSSEGDDGFGFRRIVLRGATRFLVPGGVVFLSVSFQYGISRVERLCQEAPGFMYEGVLSSTDWVPFDLRRPDLLHCLHLYAQEERRGGLSYSFRHPDESHQESISAQAALAHYQTTGKSPLTKWQTHLFAFQPFQPRFQA